MGNDWKDAEGNTDWDAHAQEVQFSEADRVLVIAMTDYDVARRKVLGSEGDVEVLWRVIVAADALRRLLGMNEPEILTGNPGEAS